MSCHSNIDYDEGASINREIKRTALDNAAPNEDGLANLKVSTLAILKNELSGELAAEMGRRYVHDC
jgi:hypothetical protein